MKYFLGLATIALLFTACKEAPVEPIPPQFNLTNTIDWSNPQPGQQTWYQRYESECDKLHRKFKWAGDTLVVEVVSRDNQLFLEETLTDNSVSRLEQGEYQPALHRIEFHDEYLLLPERWASSLFFFFGNDTLPLNVSENPTLIQEGCTLRLEDEEFIGDETGQLDQFNVGPVSIRDKRAMSCLPGGFLTIEMQAYLMFDSRELFLSHTVTDGEDVRGWVRMD